MNIFEQVLVRAALRRDRHYQAQADALMACIARHPENMREIAWIDSRGVVVRHEEDVIDLAERVGQGWWDRIGAGRVIEATRYFWHYSPDLMTPEELKEEGKRTAAWLYEPFGTTEAPYNRWAHVEVIGQNSARWTAPDRSEYIRMVG